jgi:predicted hydrocarbon binding protein
LVARTEKLAVNVKSFCLLMPLTLRLVETILELNAVVAITKCKRCVKLYEKNMVCHPKAITALSATRTQKKLKVQAIQGMDHGY